MINIFICFKRYLCLFMIREIKINFESTKKDSHDILAKFDKILKEKLFMK
jgi:hypothetical protein